MPRPRSDTFPRLESASLKFVARMILNCCRRHPTGQARKIQALSKSIPVCLANEYMKELISITIHQTELARVNPRNAMCIWCTSLTLRPSRQMMSIARNLDKLKNLTHLTVLNRPGYASVDSLDMARMIIRRIPSLHKLRSLNLMDCPVTDEMLLLEKLEQHCHKLEELSFLWNMTLDHPVALWGFQGLQRVSIQYTGMSVVQVRYFLSVVPQLHTLTIQGSLLKSLLSICRGPYRLRSLVTEYGHVSGQELASLAIHFPYLQELRITKCNYLPLITSMMDVKELSLSNCFQNRPLYNALFTRLVSLQLTSITDLQGLLGNVTSPVPAMHKLILTVCKKVDLMQVNNLFPNLRHVALHSCDVTPIQTRFDYNPPKYLEKLTVMDREDSLFQPHLAYLVSHSFSLEELKISQHRRLDDSSVYYLLQRNPMTNLKKLSLTSDRLSPSVTRVVFDYFGKDLVSAEFGGQLIDNFPDVYLQEMQEKVKPYDFNMRIGAYVSTIHVPGSQMYLLKLM